MKRVAFVIVLMMFVSSVAMAQTTAAPLAGKKPTEPQKERAGRTDETSCKWKGGEFSPGAEFCVFSGRALRCENGIWKRQDMPACIVTPNAFP